MIHSYADGRIEDTGPLTKKRMETVDDETVGRSAGLHRPPARRRQALVCLVERHAHALPHARERRTARHFRTRTNIPTAWLSTTGTLACSSTKLDELGIADNTIVFYSTDNGPHMNTWPDAGMTPFSGEKNTNWEGGWRVPAFVRWPGKIAAGQLHQRDRPPHGLAAHLRRHCRQG